MIRNVHALGQVCLAARHLGVIEDQRRQMVQFGQVVRATGHHCAVEFKLRQMVQFGQVVRATGHIRSTEPQSLQMHHLGEVQRASRDPGLPDMEHRQVLQILDVGEGPNEFGA